jgi:Matrixin
VNRKALYGAAVALLVPAAPARAEERFRQGRPAFERAEAIARAAWGALPCDGDLRVRWAPLERDTNAVSTWTEWEDGGRSFDCRVTFNERDEWSFTRFCSILVHEYGHLHGRRHSDDPDSVMYARYVSPYRPCAGGATRRGGASNASRR